MRKLIVAILAASLAIALPAAAAEPTLAKIKQSGVLKLGYRENSMPFSFIAGDSKPRGYSIDLCEIVTKDVAKQLNMPNLQVRWVPVTAQSRFESLKSGKIDLECGNTTQTLSRRADFDFSVMTYVDGASLLFLKGEKPKSLVEINGQRVAVVAGTTTEKVFDALVAMEKIGIRLLKVADHDAALKALQDRTATAYAADRTVLVTIAVVKGEERSYEVSETQFTYEPYGLMMRRDAEFRLLVDRSLSRLYRSGDIGQILQRWFEPLGEPGEVLQAMFMLNSLPD
ncbi:MAG: amino acid ABC transporter substrate-binding protein [Candidatus Accumulibacter phosphatis]|jgi:glutamate/aspartate transport system substrate-binding protein|uniref:Amino acid ABC transporter substrate-binding protein n=1 Tax=Candidatus Accumulibacter contiguus TaxID=2954381 RepID=A0ABX1T2E8_9PROT|nr:amino acid ABC transporter substrate-binding protein [Candidatus Accumulibacter contiguus]NMQ03804.1 amino acid ABC transporter substrate-binding protein [Candidatus Accumulibacter contiguus]